MHLARFWSVAGTLMLFLMISPLGSAAIQMQIVSGSLELLIESGDPGTEGIEFGLEGGTVIKQDGVYHLFTAETMKEPHFAHMRLGHWTSGDGRHWKRVGTLFESDGDFTGKSTRASLWSPMPVYNRQEGRWNLFYVAYRAKPNDETGWYLGYDGRVWRAVSEISGESGLGGPYKDKEIILQPDADSQPWEGLQGVDSFFPYLVNGKWYGFYGSAQTQANPNPAFPKWSVGLAEAAELAGPWKRRETGNPVPLDRTFAENPVVTRMANGTYVAVVDGGRSDAWGYCTSVDGIHWEPANFVTMPPPLKKRWRKMRTPLSLIREEDGTYTVFFTAFLEGSKFAVLGRVKVVIVEND